MKTLPLDKIFLPDDMPVAQSVGLRAERDRVRLWLIDKESVVVAELVVSPEDGWDLARDITSISDRAAGVR